MDFPGGLIGQWQQEIDVFADCSSVPQLDCGDLRSSGGATTIWRGGVKEVTFPDGSKMEVEQEAIAQSPAQLLRRPSAAQNEPPNRALLSVLTNMVMGTPKKSPVASTFSSVLKPKSKEQKAWEAEVRRARSDCVASLQKSGQLSPLLLPSVDEALEIPSFCSSLPKKERGKTLRTPRSFATHHDQVSSDSEDSEGEYFLDESGNPVYPA